MFLHRGVSAESEKGCSTSLRHFSLRFIKVSVHKSLEIRSKLVLHQKCEKRCSGRGCCCPRCPQRGRVEARAAGHSLIIRVDTPFLRCGPSHFELLGERVELEDIPWSLCKQLLNGGLVQGQHLEVWPALVLPGNYCHNPHFPSCGLLASASRMGQHLLLVSSDGAGKLPGRPGRPETQTESSDSESPREALVRLWLSAPHLPTERTRQVTAAVSLRCH